MPKCLYQTQDDKLAYTESKTHGSSAASDTLTVLHACGSGEVFKTQEI